MSEYKERISLLDIYSDELIVGEGDLFNIEIDL